MNSALKVGIAVVVLLGLGIAFFQYATNRDQEHFRAAKNACERGCIQDSGGPDLCRKQCVQHPDHYP